MEIKEQQIHTTWRTKLYNNTLVLNNTTTYGGGNEDGINYVAYCWSEVPGYSKFSTYEGTANGGADGPFIDCGFKPAFVLIKSDDVATSWYLFDDVRESIQTQGSNAQVLFPDTAMPRKCKRRTRYRFPFKWF